MKTKLLVVFGFAATLVMSQQVGPQQDGSFVLSSGWRIKPAGTVVPLSTFPMSTLITPDKKFLLVLHGGTEPPSISVVDLATEKELSRTPVPDAWLGFTMSKAGDKVYVGGGARAAVFEFSLANGVLKAGRTFPLVAEKDRRASDFVGDVQLAPDGHLLYVADVFRDSVVVVNPQSGFILGRFKTGRRPYRILFHPAGKSFYVSSWADGSVGQFETNKGDRLDTVRLGPHPTDMVWKAGEIEDHPEVKARVFVSASNTNNVFVLGATETGELSRLETVNLAMMPRQPLGMTPSGMGLNSDGTKLFVACSDANAAAVVDISGPRSRLAGLVPTGGYPTAAFGLPDGRMGVLNARGPVTGSVQFVDVSGEAKLEGWTREVAGNSPYRDGGLDAALADGPVRANGPIKHVLYIVKEGRSYDEVLGDVKAGNGDAALAIFGEAVTPNHHKLAREFVLLDNFHVNAEAGADGFSWATAAIAPDFAQRMWPSAYGGRRRTYDYEGQEPANAPPAGYIWTAAGQAGITLRNYGFMVDNRAKAEADGTQILSVRDPILAPNTDPNFRGFDLDYTDVDRAKEFLDELKDFEQANAMPQFLMMRLGNDRTSGTAAGKIAPLSAMADNDQALGLIVAGVSKSKFWNETAIFVVESDARAGKDHVDAHRSLALVISPWVKKGLLDGTLYNQASVLRTMELMLGLKPLTTYDAGARPMFSLFGRSATAGGYVAAEAKTPLNVRN